MSISGHLLAVGPTQLLSSRGGHCCHTVGNIKSGEFRERLHRMGMDFYRAIGNSHSLPFPRASFTPFLPVPSFYSPPTQIPFSLRSIIISYIPSRSILLASTGDND